MWPGSGLVPSLRARSRTTGLSPACYSRESERGPPDIPRFRAAPAAISVAVSLFVPCLNLADLQKGEDSNVANIEDEHSDPAHACRSGHERRRSPDRARL